MMDKTPQLPDEYKGIKIDERLGLWQLLRRTTRIIAKARQDELAQFGISGDMSAMLFAVEDLRGNAIQATIAKSLFLEPNSVSQQVKRMEKMGFVRKVRDLERKNSFRVELTPLGKDVFKKSNRHRSTKWIMSALTEAERRELWSCLAKLRDRSVKVLRVKKPILYPSSEPPAP
jgi:DNA-binding MarR family transcriptional regulator